MRGSRSIPETAGAEVAAVPPTLTPQVRTNAVHALPASHVEAFGLS